MNYPFIKDCLDIDGCILYYISEYSGSQYFACKNIYLVKRAIQQNGIAIRYANIKFKKNIELAIIAILNNPLAIKQLDKELTLNIELNMLAIEKDPTVWYDLDKDIKKKDIIYNKVISMVDEYHRNRLPYFYSQLFNDNNIKK